MATIRRFLDDDAGADLIEYALVVGLVSLAAAAVISPLAPNIRAMLDRVSSTLNGITW